MKKTIAIVGGGPAALFLAAHLDENQYDVTIYEKNRSLVGKISKYRDLRNELAHCKLAAHGKEIKKNRSMRVFQKNPINSLERSKNGERNKCRKNKETKGNSGRGI